MCHYLGGGLHGRQKRVKAQSESSKSVVNSVLISREMPVFPGFLEIIRVVLLKVLDLLHDLFENFGAVLWRIAVFYKADLDLQLQLIADVLIVQPVSKRRFGVDNLFDLLRQSLALVVDDSTPSTSLSVPYSKSYWSRRARRIRIKKVAGEKILQQLCL
jgi:hypothetical protein